MTTSASTNAREVIRTILEGGPHNGHDIGDCGDYASIVQDLLAAQETGGGPAVSLRWSELTDQDPNLMQWVCNDEYEAPTDPLTQLLAEIEPLPDQNAIEQHLLDRVDQAAALSKADLMKLEPQLRERGVAARWIQQWKAAIKEARKARPSKQKAPTVQAPPADQAVPTATAKVLCKHPETDADLFLPPGYTLMPWGEGQAIMKFSGRELVHVYTGIIFVKGLGTNLHTGDQTITVCWQHPGTETWHEITIPRTSLSDTRDFGAAIGGAGAVIHAENRSKVAAFLAEFAAANRTNLPHTCQVNRLGLGDDRILVLPGGILGTEEEVRYLGRPHRMGTSFDSYPHTIRTILAWEGNEVIVLVLAFVLASPIIARLTPRRNPVIYLAGGSSIGKTTLAMFALGMMGDPARHPFKMEGKKVSSAAFFQTLAELNGLPLLIDEAHTNDRPDHLEGLCYQFANGQRYTRGTLEQQAAGGDEVAGSLLLAGERMLAFLNAGATKRVLWIDCEHWLPLGAGAGAASALGHERALLLEEAIHSGAGLFAPHYYRYVWENWGAFQERVDAYQTVPELKVFPSWTHTLAIAAASYEFLLHLIHDDRNLVLTDFSDWQAILEGGQSGSDPAVQAFETLLMMLIQSRTNDGFAGYVPPEGWEERWLDGKLLACKRHSDNFWRVLSTAPQIRTYTRTENAVQQYGGTWAERKWIIPNDEKSKDGNIKRVSTASATISNGQRARVLKIPVSILEGWNPHT